MSQVFDLYVPRSTWLHRLDPRVKLWATVVGFTIAFLLPNLIAQLVFLLALHALLLSQHIPWRALYGLWRQMAILIVLILILQPIFKPIGPTIFEFGPLSLTSGGIYQAAVLAVRTLVLAFVMGTLLFTTNQHALVRAFVRLGLPYTWGLTLSLTLRFLPAIHSLFISIREAQAARGWVPKGNFLRRIREYLPVLIAVVIGTLRMSDQLTLALAARGLGTMQPRTTWHELRMRANDRLAFAVLTLGLGYIIGWRLFFS
jgi:energy-coupling factor transport system permease protein